MEKFDVLALIYDVEKMLNQSAKSRSIQSNIDKILKRKINSYKEPFAFFDKHIACKALSPGEK